MTTKSSYLSSSNHGEPIVNTFFRNCRYCGKSVLFDSRVRSRNNYLVPLNESDRTIHECLKTRFKNHNIKEEYQDLINAISEESELKEDYGLDNQSRTNVAEGTTIQQSNHQKVGMLV